MGEPESPLDELQVYYDVCNENSCKNFFLLLTVHTKKNQTILFSTYTTCVLFIGLFGVGVCVFVCDCRVCVGGCVS